jgi:hypothetical protein
MIQQIYITDYLSEAAAESAVIIQNLVAQCPVLLKADWLVTSTPPLRTLFNNLCEAKASTAKISPVSAVLCERHSWVMERPALCLLPVHLNLQRDTFALQGTVALTAEVYTELTSKLQQHFAHDFIVIPEPELCFWWIQPLSPVEVECPWPQDCLYQQAFQWQPQGNHAPLIRQWTNEIQMLLHQIASETNMDNWPMQLNSLWFASVPALPTWKHDKQVVHGQGIVFDGLKACHLPALKSLTLAQALADAKLSSALMVVDQAEQVNWQALAAALQQGKINTLEIVLPFVERSVRISYCKHYRWQFWRKAYTLETLLQQLESSLPTATLPTAV